MERLFVPPPPKRLFDPVRLDDWYPTVPGWSGLHSIQLAVRGLPSPLRRALRLRLPLHLEPCAVVLVLVVLRLEPVPWPSFSA